MYIIETAKTIADFWPDSYIRSSPLSSRSGFGDLEIPRDMIPHLTNTSLSHIHSGPASWMPDSVFCVADIIDSRESSKRYVAAIAWSDEHVYYVLNCGLWRYDEPAPVDRYFFSMNWKRHPRNK